MVGTAAEASRYRRVAAAILALAVVLAGGLLVGAWATDDPAPDVPTTESVDAGFARAMQAHHAQAVRMSLLVRDATDDPEVRMLALDVLLTQQQQLGQMFAWLDGWGLSQVSSRPMAWMMSSSDGSEANHEADQMESMDDPSDAGAAGAAMPGMASDTDLNRLADSEGEAAERLYLRLMIPHHRGGVQMARYAMREAQLPQVRRLAGKIASAQRAEIALLQSMLKDRSGPTEPQ